MIYQGEVKFKEQWYGVRAEFIIDELGEAPCLDGHPDNWYPGYPTSLYFEEVTIIPDEGDVDGDIESQIISRLNDKLVNMVGEDVIERTFYL